MNEGRAMKSNTFIWLILFSLFFTSCEKPSFSKKEGISSDILFELSLAGQWDEFTESLELYDGDINVTDSLTQTLLIISCYQPNENITKKIIQKGADINKATKSGKSPLHAAVYNDNEKAAQLLIQAGANIDILDEDNDTPLHWAAKKQSYKVMRVLLDNGANPNAINKTGWVPLQCLLMSSRKPSLDSVEMLLRYGANPNYINKDPYYGDSSVFPRKAYPVGVTALEIAKEGNYPDIIALLKKYGAK